MHILGVEFKKGLAKISGFHHDFILKIEKNGWLNITNKNLKKHGIYSADVWWNGKRIRKTFFPPHWPQEKVISKVLEAYEDFVKAHKKGLRNYKITSNGLYRLDGFTRERIEIRMFITKNAEIKTAYPIV